MMHMVKAAAMMMRSWRRRGDVAMADVVRMMVMMMSAMMRSARVVLGRAEGGLSNLAVIASVAPFVGLFGTVWGIMTAFRSIAASRNTSLAVVAPGIAEALFATAIGLFAAIPALIAYNKLQGDVAKKQARLEGFADEFSSILSRQIDQHAVRERAA